MRQYHLKVGPKLRNLWDEIRMDIDTDQNGGVLMTLEVFFPNKESLKRISIDDEDKFRKYLQLFVTIETWFMQIQTSLLLFEEKNKIIMQAIDDVKETCVQMRQDHQVQTANFEYLSEQNKKAMQMHD